MVPTGGHDPKPASKKVGAPAFHSDKGASRVRRLATDRRGAMVPRRSVPRRRRQVARDREVYGHLLARGGSDADRLPHALREPPMDVWR